jgi:hypothetical protein
MKHHVNTATANSIVLRSLSSPPPWQRTCGRWCHARSGAKFDWWVVACPVLLDLSHVYAPIKKKNTQFRCWRCKSVCVSATSCCCQADGGGRSLCQCFFCNWPNFAKKRN